MTKWKCERACIMRCACGGGVAEGGRLGRRLADLRALLCSSKVFFRHLPDAGKKKQVKTWADCHGYNYTNSFIMGIHLDLISLLQVINLKRGRGAQHAFQNIYILIMFLNWSIFHHPFFWDIAPSYLRHRGEIAYFVAPQNSPLSSPECCWGCCCS